MISDVLIPDYIKEKNKKLLPLTYYSNLYELLVELLTKTLAALPMQN